MFESTIGNKNLILGVEVIKGEAVRIFFNKEDLPIVKHTIHNLYPQTVRKFGQDVAAYMVDEDPLKRAKSSNEIELAYDSRLKTITNNPQGPTDDDED